MNRLFATVLFVMILFPVKADAKQFDLLLWLSNLFKSIEITVKQEPDIISADRKSVV